MVCLRFPDLHLLPDATFTVLVAPPKFRLDLNTVNVDKTMGCALLLIYLEVVGMAQQGVLRPAMMFGVRIIENDIFSNLFFLSCNFCKNTVGV